MLQFDVRLERPGEALDGRMELQTGEGQVQGYLTVSGRQEAFCGRVLRKNHFLAALRFCADGRTEDCDALLILREDGALTGAAMTGGQLWTLTGALTEER